MENEDVNISQMLNDLYKKTEAKVEDEMNEKDSLTQARRLLSNWANQTESFTKNKKKQGQNKKKVVQYRKLDAPMMVVKKETIRPSIDPTLIMEARLAHVKEMKAKRLKRMAQKNNANNDNVSVHSKASSVISVDIPDIDSEIKSYKNRIAEKMKEKEREFEERTRRAEKIKVIDENMAHALALENEIRMREEEMMNPENSEEMQLKFQSLVQSYKLQEKKMFFTKWTNECNFHSNAFHKAEALSNYRVKSAAFSLWRARFRKKQQEKEANILGRQLRKNKQMEMLAEQFDVTRTLRSFFSQWKVKYTASIEYKIVEEQHKKRRNLILNKININNSDDEKLTPSSKIENPTNDKPTGKRELKIPKTKIRQIKLDPKFEAMTKRMEEQRMKKLSKIQKEAAEQSTKEEEQVKQQIEIQRKKKQQHREFLEHEKIKREEMKRKQLQYEKNSQRRKYCEKVSQEFRLKSLVKNQFRQWKKILLLRDRFETNAFNNYNKCLALKAFKIMKSYAIEQRETRQKQSETKFEMYIARIHFDNWKKKYMHILDIEAQVTAISNKYRAHKALIKLHEEKKKRRKNKYITAANHSNRTLLRKIFKAWPIACSQLKEEEERETNRQNLMSKALKFLEELDSDEL